LVLPAFAGGWAVITLDELPSNVVMGESITVGFMVLQHGRTPMTGLYPIITANSDHEEFLVTAEPEGKPGHYTAILTFPKDGDWQWSIQAFTMQQAMPVLRVTPVAVVSANPPVARTKSLTSFVSPVMIASVLLALGLVGAVITYRRRSRQAVVLTAFSLLVGIGLFITGAATASHVEAQAKPASESSASQVELGRQLFIAKGCITCHFNSKAAGSSEYSTIEMGGPDLSTFSVNAEVLRLRLKDPSLVKSDTKMPNLNLSKVEIEALISFINSK